MQGFVFIYYLWCFRTRNIHVLFHFQRCCICLCSLLPCFCYSGVNQHAMFLERGIFMCLCTLSQCFRYNNLWTNRPPGMLLLMRCDFPIDNSFVSGRVHSTNRTNRSNRQRWTAGSVVSNEMRFSDRQHPRFGSCPFDESNESVESTTLNRRVCCQ